MLLELFPSKLVFPLHFPSTKPDIFSKLMSETPTVVPSIKQIQCDFFGIGVTCNDQRRLYFTMSRLKLTRPRSVTTHDTKAKPLAVAYSLFLYCMQSPTLDSSSYLGTSSKQLDNINTRLSLCCPQQQSRLSTFIIHSTARIFYRFFTLQHAAGFDQLSLGASSLPTPPELPGRSPLIFADFSLIFLWKPLPCVKKKNK